MEEEERILLQRESAKHDEKIAKQLMRDLMYSTKVNGFNQILDKEVKYLKVFLGYIIEIGLFTDVEVMSALTECIKKGSYRQKIEKVLMFKCIEADKIVELLEIED